MKTNYLFSKKINKFFCLLSIILFPLFGEAQLTVDVNNNVGIGASAAYMINANKVLWNNNVTSCIFVGVGAGTSTTGTNNTFIGNNAGNANGTGTNNTGAGFRALWSNASGLYNTAVGSYALQTINGLSENTAFGYGVLSMSGNSGNSNTGMGKNALYGNQSGSYNTAVGDGALGATTNGAGNTSIGYYAGNIGNANTTGSYNTYVGYQATGSYANWSNSTAIGNGAIVDSTNHLRLGNTAVVGVYSSATAYHTSDGRFKTNVTENVKGLIFIKKLRPVTYNLDTKSLDNFMIQNMADSMKTMHQQGMDFSASMSKIHSGFIAQEVEKAANDVGFKSSIVSAGNGTIAYGLSYEEIVVPLVKAVQELSKSADSVAAVNSKQDSIIQSLQAQINRIVNTCCPNTSHQMQNNGSNGSSTSPNVPAVGNTNVNLTDAVVLNQNVPNPFAEQTIITYNIPVINNSAQILFYNTNGTLIKTVDIKTAGSGQLTVFANDLSNGIYSYTLVVDGSIIDTKRMVKQQ